MKSPKFANAIVALMVPGCILLFSCDRFTPVGRIFAVDSSSVYGFGCQPRYYS